MKNVKIQFLLILSALLLNSNVLFGQVYFSRSIDGEVFVGPANVYSMSQTIKDRYIDLISYEIDQLDEESYIMDSLLLRPKLGRKDRKELKYLKANALRRSDDQRVLKILLLDWANVNLESYKDEEVVDYYHEGLLRSARIFIVDEYDIDLETVELIEVNTKFFDEPQWEKRKASSNCLSPNLDDCLVWCLISHSSTVVDITDEIVHVDTRINLNDFELNESGFFLERQILFDFKNDEAVYLAKDTKTNKVIPIGNIFK